MLSVRNFGVESSIAHFTVKPVNPSMFRLMVSTILLTREDSTTELAWKTSAFVFSHVQLVVVFIVISFPTNTAEIRVLSGVVLGVPFKPCLR